jgi:glutathione synthase/RimK-type ligase-like ATP-grasp enzyme
MAQGVYDFCLREARSALLGSILSKKVKIMSPPSSIWSAEHKVLQLTVARDVGLQIPETIITNEPAQITEAFKRFGGNMITKPVRSGFVDYGSEQHAIFTSQVLEDHLQRVADARWSPAIYQPLIPKQFDVRVTVVGSQFFSAEIDSQSDPDAAVDWRHTSNPQLPHREASIPNDVKERLKSMLDILQLRFAAIDLIRTPDGEYVFLEVNPNGQWLWLDDFLNLGISQTVAEWLSNTQDLLD